VQERVQQPDQPAVGGREELLEAPAAALTHRWLLICGGTPLSRHKRGGGSLSPWTIFDSLLVSVTVVCLVLASLAA
jgi:hypothetical protein